MRTRGFAGPSNGIICDDDNECTTGTCRPDFLCTYTNGPERQRMRRWQPLHGSESGLPDRWPSRTSVYRQVRSATSAPTACAAGASNTDAASLHCEDNNVCNGIVACDPTTGNSCVQTVPPLTCAPDTNPCTTDTCDPVLGCNWPNTVFRADDGNACTGPERL